MQAIKIKVNVRYIALFIKTWYLQSTDHLKTFNFSHN